MMIRWRGVPDHIRSVTGLRVSTGTAESSGGSEGDAMTVLQKTEHAVGTMPFSSPAHPLHLPGMGMSPDMGMSAAAAIAALSGMLALAKPCATNPSVNRRAASKADI
jgi:hypothetical protein